MGGWLQWSFSSVLTFQRSWVLARYFYFSLEDEAFSLTWSVCSSLPTSFWQIFCPVSLILTYSCCWVIKCDNCGKQPIILILLSLCPYLTLQVVKGILKGPSRQKWEIMANYIYLSTILHIHCHHSGPSIIVSHQAFIIAF